VESAACLDVLVARKLKSEEETSEGKLLAEEIVNMLMGLLRRYDSYIEEDTGEYRREPPPSS
jgi:hypothetical protein